MNTKRRCDPCGIMQDWFLRIANVEQITVTHEQDINALQAVVSDLEEAIVGNVNLSLLVINTDKDWQGYSITNVGSLDVNGNISVGGTVDGVDVSNLSAEFNLHEHSGKNLTNVNNITCASVNCSGNTYGTNIPYPVVASSTPRNYSDSEKTFPWNTVLMKQKSISFLNGLGRGTFNVYFELKAQGTNSTTTVYGQVYKNGQPIGTLRSMTGQTWTGWTETFNGPLLPNDTIELWCKQQGGSGDGGICRNCRIMYDPVVSPMPSDATDATPNYIIDSLISRTRPVIMGYTTPSDTVQWAKDEEASTTSTSYTTLKSFRCCTVLYGYKVKVDVKNSATGISYVQLYKNGAAISGEITTALPNYTTKDLGTYYGLLPGDLLEIKVKAGSGTTAYVKNAKVCFTTTQTTTEFI